MAERTGLRAVLYTRTGNMPQGLGKRTLEPELNRICWKIVARLWLGRSYEDK